MRIAKICHDIITKILLNTSRKRYIFWFNTMKNCRINDGVLLNKKSSFFNVGIGFGSYISISAQVANTEIGKFCSIGPNLVCGFGIHPIDGVSTSPAFYSTGKQNGFTFSSSNKIEECKTVYIGNDVFIGANVTILDGVTIGDGAVIGAGAVVSKNVAPYAVAIGCPISVVKHRFTPDIINKLLTIKWWDKDENGLQKVEKYFYNVNEFIENV